MINCSGTLAWHDYVMRMVSICSKDLRIAIEPELGGPCGVTVDGVGPAVGAVGEIPID